MATDNQLYSDVSCANIFVDRPLCGRSAFVNWAWLSDQSVDGQNWFANGTLFLSLPVDCGNVARTDRERVSGEKCVQFSLYHYEQSVYLTLGPTFIIHTHKAWVPADRLHNNGPQ